MITVRLKGGLGNQMFQYAFGKATASKLNVNFQLDCTLLLDRGRGKKVVYRGYDLDIFKLQPQFNCSPALLRLLFSVKSATYGKLLRNWLQQNTKYYKEPYFHLDKEALQHPADDTLYEGWWQAWKYFDSIQDELRADFTFKNPILPESMDLLNEINSSNSICLNVRRTDFVGNDTLDAIDINYFKKAVDWITSHVTNPYFFIFSDDIDWCKAHIQLSHSHQFVEHHHKGVKFSNYLQLMTRCKHFIIPNSSFAWWSAWLGSHPEKIVVAPISWFNDPEIKTDDLIPAEWIRV